MLYELYVFLIDNLPVFSLVLDLQVESYLQIIGEPKLPSTFLQVSFSQSSALRTIPVPFDLYFVIPEMGHYEKWL